MTAGEKMAERGLLVTFQGDDLVEVSIGGIAVLRVHGKEADAYRRSSIFDAFRESVDQGVLGARSRHGDIWVCPTTSMVFRDRGGGESILLCSGDVVASGASGLVALRANPRRARPIRMTRAMLRTLVRNHPRAAPLLESIRGHPNTPVYCESSGVVYAPGSYVMPFWRYDKGSERSSPFETLGDAVNCMETGDADSISYDPYILRKVWTSVDMGYPPPGMGMAFFTMGFNLCPSGYTSPCNPTSDGSIFFDPDLSGWFMDGDGRDLEDILPSWEPLMTPAKMREIRDPLLAGMTEGANAWVLASYWSAVLRKPIAIASEGDLRLILSMEIDRDIRDTDSCRGSYDKQLRKWVFYVPTKYVGPDPAPREAKITVKTTEGVLCADVRFLRPAGGGGLSMEVSKCGSEEPPFTYRCSVQDMDSTSRLEIRDGAGLIAQVVGNRYIVVAGGIPWNIHRGGEVP